MCLLYDYVRNKNEIGKEKKGNFINVIELIIIKNLRIKVSTVNEYDYF